MIHHPKIPAPARGEAALPDIIARAEADPESDDARFLSELVAVVEMPSERLLARRHAWPAGPAYLYPDRRG